ncbi:MAG: hypothetical protein GXN97_02990 [Aquificae bacterium]|nr:hypothetical protein [Aquificota bacterium]
METSPRFLTQWHLQKIARWLTLFGYPTRVVKELTKEDIAFCAAKRCTVLTTSRRWENTFKNLKVDYFLLPNTEDWITQLCMVLRHFNIQPELKLNYCPHCLSPLKPVPKEEVFGKIPYPSYKCGKNFTLCPQCGQIYWQGGHTKLMDKTLKRIKKRCKELFKQTF